ncbi:hypothetical protein [Acetobacter pasteurianus]
MPGRAFPTALSALLAGCAAVVLPVGAHNAAQAQSTTTSPLTAQTAVAPVIRCNCNTRSQQGTRRPAQADRPLDAESLGPDLNAIRRPPNTPIPPSGVPVLPFPGMATMSVQPVGHRAMPRPFIRWSWIPFWPQKAHRACCPPIWMHCEIRI